MTTIAEAIAAQEKRAKRAFGIVGVRVSETERLGRAVMREVDREHWRRRSQPLSRETRMLLGEDEWSDPTAWDAIQAVSRAQECEPEG